MRKTWTESDAQRLRELRERAGAAQAAFAQRHALSVGQVRELEGGKTGSFYTEEIKAHTGRKLLAALGYIEPPDTPAAADSMRLEQPEPEPEPQPVSPPDVAQSELVQPGTPQPEPPTPADPGSGPEPESSSPQPLAAAAGTTMPQPAQGPALEATAAPKRRSLAPTLALALVVAGAAIWLMSNRAAPGAGAVSTITEPVAVAAPTSEPAASEARASEASAPASAAAPPASAPAAAAAVATASASRLPAGCEAPAAREPTAYQSPVADKPATYIYVESTRDAKVCVIDSQNRVRMVTLQAGESVNVGGNPPFTIRSTQWNDLKVFFQGLRVQLEPGVPTDNIVILPRRGA